MDNGTNPNNYPMNNMSDKKEHGERIDMPPGNFPIRRASNLSNTLRRSMRSILPNVDDKKNKKTSDEDKKWVKWIHDRLPPNSTPNDPIPEAAFIKLLAASSLSPSVVFIKRLFNIWDKKYGRKTYLTVMELETELVGISNLDPLGKLRLLWLIYDDDESGELSKDEFASILQCCVDDNSLELSEYQRDVLIETLFRDIDTDADEQISFQEFENWIEAHPEFNKKFVLSASKFFKPPDAKAVAKKKKKGCSWPTVLTRKFIQNHRSEVCWTLFAVLIFIVCFLYGSLDAAFNMKYRHGEHKITSDKCFPFYSVAHGFGFNLNVWPVVLCLLMCRRILSAIRNSRLGFFMPVDHAVHAHKILGWWPTTICVFGHFIMHMFHFNCLSGGDQATYIDLLFTTKPGLGYFGALSITGWILLFSHIIMFIGAHPAVRRRGNFEFFFWTHLLYLVYYVVLIIHSWKFWYFFIIPGILFIIEKFLGSKFWQTQSVGDFYIEDVMIWPSGTVGIFLNHPVKFKFQPGDYAFVNIPSLAQFEWHPFTISSAPENSDTVTFHIRALGGWTKQLPKFLSANEGGVKVFPNQGKSKKEANKGQKLKAMPTVIRRRRLSMRGVAVKQLKIPIYLDGPYGTPSVSIFRAEHAVLVCAGIGVTPFSAIIESIVLRCKIKEQRCPNCENVWLPENSTDILGSLKKVEFIWVVRSQREVEWFLEKLHSFETDQEELQLLEDFVDIKIYVTGAKKMNDLNSFFFSTAADLLYKNVNRDLISGLRNRATPGRPNWNKIFKDYKEKDWDYKTTVFYCGPRMLAQQLGELCEAYQFEFKKENF